MSDTDVVDAEIVEEDGTDLDVVPPTALFKTDDPVQVVTEATKVADALKDVIVQRELFTRIQGKDHVRVEGWQLLGGMLGVTAICTHTEPVDGGYKATVEARTADGRVVGRADALCTKYEKRGPWKSADDYARLSMAQTRATSKALKGPLGFVISMAGYATTPAEEMTFAEPDKGGHQQSNIGVDVPSGDQLDLLEATLKRKPILLPEVDAALVRAWAGAPGNLKRGQCSATLDVLFGKSGNRDRTLEKLVASAKAWDLKRPASDAITPEGFVA